MLLWRKNKLLALQVLGAFNWVITTGSFVSSNFEQKWGPFSLPELFLAIRYFSFCVERTKRRPLFQLIFFHIRISWHIIYATNTKTSFSWLPIATTIFVCSSSISSFTSHPEKRGWEKWDRRRRRGNFSSLFLFGVTSLKKHMRVDVRVCSAVICYWASWHCSMVRR